MIVKELIKLLSEEDQEAEVGSLIVSVKDEHPVSILVASKFTMAVTAYPKDNKVFITGQAAADKFIKTDYPEGVEDLKV